MKVNRIIYWSSTGLLSAILLMSAGMYVFNNEMVSQMFSRFGYPTYIIYPLAVAKVAAVIVLVTQKQATLKEWAYSALFFELIFAFFFIHVMIGDGEQMGAIIAMALLITSYIFGKRTFKKTIV